MKELYENTIRPFIDNHKEILLIIAIIGWVIVVVLSTSHKHQWEDVSVKGTSNLWTSTRSDGSKTQFIVIIQKCKTCNDYRSFKLDGEQK